MCSESRTTAIIIPSSCKLSGKADTGQSFQRTPMPKLVSFTHQRYIFTRKHSQNKPIACGEALNVDMITHNLAFHIWRSCLSPSLPTVTIFSYCIDDSGKHWELGKSDFIGKTYRFWRSKTSIISPI